MRFHLRPGQSVLSVAIDGSERGDACQVGRMIAAAHPSLTREVLPFQGEGSQPPPLAGAVFEMRLDAKRVERHVEITVMA